MWSLTGCGIASEVINHEANDQRLLKAGALDVSINEIYKKYQYNFLDQYRITHDFIMASGCNYRVKKPIGIKDLIPSANYAISDALDIFEQNNHTYQRSYQTKDINHLNPDNIDRYVRPEFDRGLDPYGKPLPKGKGFQPMCFEAWQGTQHFLTVYLHKRKLDIPNIYGLQDGVISHEKVGSNHWWVQKFDLRPYQANGAGRIVESWVLPIADSGYTFIFEFGANQDSLKYPQAHAQMQAIFKHLIESVKIEPINSAK